MLGGKMNLRIKLRVYVLKTKIRLYQVVERNETVHKNRALKGV